MHICILRALFEACNSYLYHTYALPLMGQQPSPPAATAASSLKATYNQIENAALDQKGSLKARIDIKSSPKHFYMPSESKDRLSQAGLPAEGVPSL